MQTFVGSNEIAAKDCENAKAVFSSRYQAIIVLVVLAVWCWVDVWPRGSLDPARPENHRTDFTVYTKAGQAALAGENPYAVTNARGWSYLYLPPFALLVSPLARLSEGWQCVLWFWISIACLYGAFREFTILDRWAFPRAWTEKADRLAAWGGIVCIIGFSLATLNCLQRGQVGVLQLYLTLLGGRMILTETKRWSAFVGGALLAGGIILKLSPALPASVLVGGIAFVALRSHDKSTRPALLRSLAVFSGLVVGLVAGIWILPASIVGWERNQTYLQTWRRDVLARTNELSHDPFAGDSHSRKNQSPMNGVWLLGNALLRAENAGDPTSKTAVPMDSPFGKKLQLGVRVISILATSIALLAILWRGCPNSLLVAFAVANSATLLVVPIARGHYFMAMWPAAVWAPRWLMQFNPMHAKFQLSCWWLTQIPPILLILHYLFESTLGPLGVLGIGTWIWQLLLTFTVLIVLCRSRNILINR